MERKNNIRKPKTFTAVIKLTAVLFFMSLLIGLLLTNEIKKEDEGEYIFSLVVFGIITLIIVVIIFLSFNVFLKTIYRINYLNNQITFYKYNYVFITQRKECTTITKKRNKIIFEFSIGLKLIVITRILFFVQIKRVDKTLINKRNFPHSNFIVKTKER